MESIDFYQVSIFLMQSLFIGFTILFLFNLRNRIGLGALFTVLGLFQFVQMFLANNVYFKITDQIIISPGSAVLFSSTLFTILLVYIKEGAAVTRKLIYALIITNVVLCFLILSFRLNLAGIVSYNPYEISTQLFYTNMSTIIVGMIGLFLDSILIIFAFEFISKHIKHLFFRICITMLFVLVVDSIIYMLGAFWHFDNLKIILIAGIIGKVVCGFVYSLIFYGYLMYIEREKFEPTYHSYKDVYQALTYRQKYEVAEQAVRISQKRYATLARTLPVGIFLTEPDGKTTFVNPEYCKIAGLTMDQALNFGWLNALHPEDKTQILEQWGENSKEQSESHAEYRFLRQDGSVTWVLGQATPEFNDQKEIIGYIGTITDITNIKLYEQKLNQLKDRAEESDRLKSAFLSNMSHEIRTPMNGILGVAELLKEPKLSGEEHDLYLNLIEESGHRMLNIIKDIIDISRIESGQVKTNISKVSINDEMECIFNSFESEANSKQLDFYMTSDLDSHESIIQTDKEKLKIVLINLIKNALKYTEQGGITMGYQKLKNKLQFFIKDTGVGIPEKRQKAIFDRFVQADLNDNYAMEGAGIGLSIAKAYVEMLEGTIWLESKEGVGSTFYFTIPCEE